ncbi:MAG: hypothetical protein GC162_21070 [Planctomycetes bacterium]|nr:hypothetical protein [Planctomycetota bacterium]
MRTLSLMLLVFLTACAAPSATRSAGSSPHNHTAAKPAAGNDAPTADSGAIIALVDGKPVRWSALLPMLVESAGGSALGEWVLDRQIERALAEQHVTLTQADLDREKQYLAEQLSPDANEAIRLLNQLRDDRGLGPVRFNLLLKRNAGLRRLVQPDVSVNEAMIGQAYEQQYGVKTVARLILVPSLTEAGALLNRLHAGESFIDLAIDVSKDASRAQGGLLPPISAQDATFPKGIRDVAVRLEPGQVSEPIAVEGGFAILKCERKISAQAVPLAQVHDDLARQLRLSVERSLMQRKARVLLEQAQVTVLDAEMDRAWKQQKKEMVGQEK